MALRQFEAFLDDTQVITIQMPTHCIDTELHFTIYETKTQHVLNHHIETSYELDDTTIYRIHLEQPITWECFYTVYDNDRNHTVVQFRHIVRTTAFDQYYTDQSAELGAFYQPDNTSFKLWAPISTQVILFLNDQTIPLTRTKKGIWQTTVLGDWDSASYYYVHHVNGKWIQTTDPYALSSNANGTINFVIDTNKLLPTTRVSNPVAPTQSIIYELSVRDFTSDPSVKFHHAKKFLGLGESPQHQSKSTGLLYLKELGITHVQLMPIFDFASVDENYPNLTYNWGYDPMQYNVPEGSFSSNPNDAYTRIMELQQAIQTYHENNISVIMDVVYNHVYDIDAFSFERIVPGYCYRVDDKQKKTNGTWCGNDIASERGMIRHFIKNSLKYWLNVIGVDGFRFDLMGIIDSETMQIVTEELRAIYPNILLYGEGWKMHTGLPSHQLAHQYNAHSLQNIGFFNDMYRDNLKLALRNPYWFNQHENHQLLETLLSGSVGMNYNYALYAFAHQTINYVECHDNATLYDYFIAHGLDEQTIQEKAKLALGILLISRGITFIHSGQEFLRTKNGIDNTYNSGDHINSIDWTRRVMFDDMIEWVKPLIKLRRTHPAFLDNTPEAIKQHTQFYWLTSHVLKMSIGKNENLLTVYINFSENDYSLEKPIDTIFPSNMVNTDTLLKNSIMITAV